MKLLLSAILVALGAIALVVWQRQYRHCDSCHELVPESDGDDYFMNGTWYCNHCMEYGANHER